MFSLRKDCLKKEIELGNKIIKLERKLSLAVQWLAAIGEDTFENLERPEIKDHDAGDRQFNTLLSGIQSRLIIARHTIREEMRRSQHERDRQTILFKFVLDNIPFPVFIKDADGRYIMVNREEARLFNVSTKDLLGKDDSHFVINEEEWRVIRESDERALSADLPVQLPLQHFTTSVGHSYVFRTTKIPFVNPTTGEKNILGISVDLTETYHLGNKLILEKRVGKNTVLINIAGRQKMLSQKIGFHCASLLLGRRNHGELLRNAMDIFENSLRVMQFGGIPIGILCEDPLPPSEAQWLSCYDKMADAWQPVRRTAEKILSYVDEESKPHEQKEEMQRLMTIIEEQTEHLLQLNDELMTGFVGLVQEKKIIL
jgi:PAS domain S-box-containing protein